MKKEDLTVFSVEDLRSEATAERDRLLKLRFAHAVSPIENPMRIRESRKRIARLLTQLTIKTRQA
jgi:large subunit ribosomal protein L29